MRKMKNPFIVFLSLCCISLAPAYAQSVPNSFVNAEGGSAPTPLPDSYSFYTYNSSTGSKASASASAGHTLGVQADASITGEKTAEVSSDARLRVAPGSNVSNTIGGNPEGVLFDTSTSTVSDTNSVVLPGSEDIQMNSQSSISSTIQGISALSTLSIAPSAEDCSSNCNTGSSFSSSSSLSTPTDPSSPATSTAGGGAKGFMNSNINTNAEQSSFTQVFIQTF